MKQLITLSFLIVTVLLNAQDSFTVRGKIERLSKSHSVIIGSSWGTFTGEIKDDGSFLITGKGIKMAGFALIYTDSSGANSIWLEPGEYFIDFKETRFDTIRSIIFRIPKLIGPKDAEIYHGFHEKFFDFNYVPREQRRQVTRDFVVQYIDSVFKYFQSSKILPDLLRSSISLLDDQAIQSYYSLLSVEQIASPQAKQLSNYYDRKNKIEAEKTFQNFSLQTDDDRMFELNSIKDKKLILIDFWSSSCAPCRRNHVKLVDLYKKYSARGLEIVSISLDDDKKEWLTAIKKDNMTWINVSELKGWKTMVANNYFVGSIPYSFLLDQDRKIISNARAFTDEEIEEYLKK